MTFSIHFEIDDASWKKRRGLTARLEEAARLALRRGGVRRKAALTILLTGDAHQRALNHDFRGKNKPTNVLSFPAAPNAENYLGDVALAFGVTGGRGREIRQAVRRSCRASRRPRRPTPARLRSHHRPPGAEDGAAGDAHPGRARHRRSLCGGRVMADAQSSADGKPSLIERLSQFLRGETAKARSRSARASPR